ncbi:hypothetical protein RQP46_005772 [Phenoliferia psychrophenolica]
MTSSIEWLSSQHTHFEVAVECEGALLAIEGATELGIKEVKGYIEASTGKCYSVLVRDKSLGPDHDYTAVLLIDGKRRAVHYQVYDDAT